MERHFDEELKKLNEEILRMGAFTEEAIYKSIETLKNRDRNGANEVIMNDKKIDALELDIDERCIDLIARYQPMAGDLRFIATAFKVNSELERIADLAVDICQRVLDLVDKPLLKPLTDIPALSGIAQKMVHDAIDSFIKKDVAIAKNVVLSDSQADQLRNQIQDELIKDYMSLNAATISQAVSLILIARHLERMCDHATNIAEDVIYMVEAKVVKHHREEL